MMILLTVEIFIFQFATITVRNVLETAASLHNKIIKARPCIMGFLSK